MCSTSEVGLEPGRMVLALLAVLIVSGCGNAVQPVDLIIENITIYSGVDASPVSGAIAIVNGRFVAAGRITAGRYRATKTIDGSGMYVIPGLWDAHVHLRSSVDRGLHPEDFFAHGVTSLRDMGSVMERAQELRDEIARGELPAPTIYPAYWTLNGELFGPHQAAVTTQEEVAAAIAALADNGARIIKIHRATLPDLLPEIVRASHQRGLKVTGHIPLGVHPLDACEEGMDGVEHAGSFIEALVSVGEEEGWVGQRAAGRWLLSADADSLYRCLERRGVSVTPTLNIYPAIAKRHVGNGEMPSEFVEAIDMLQKVTRRLHEANVPLLVGTDVSDLAEPMPLETGASLYQEMLMLEQAGISPGDIVRMATLNVARTVGADTESGSIESGKVADFVLLSADPGKTARNLQAVVSVFQAGEVVFSR